MFLLFLIENFVLIGAFFSAYNICLDTQGSAIIMQLVNENIWVKWGAAATMRKVQWVHHLLDYSLSHIYLKNQSLLSLCCVRQIYKMTSLMNKIYFTKTPLQIKYFNIYSIQIRKVHSVVHYIVRDFINPLPPLKCPYKQNTIIETSRHIIHHHMPKALLVFCLSVRHENHIYSHFFTSSTR